MASTTAQVRDLAGRLAAGAAAAGAAIVAQRALEAGWRRRTGHAPPSKNPLDRDSSLRDALIWTAVVTAGVAAARVLARKGTERLLARSAAPEAETVV